MNRISGPSGPSEQAPPRSLLKTIAAGFEQVTSHLWLALLPVLLDVLYWLGPRLSMQVILERNLLLLADEPATAELREMLLGLAPRTNLLNSLTFPIIGVPSLIAGPTPDRTPIYTPITEVDTVWVWLTLFVLFSAIGLLLTGLYFALIADALDRGTSTPRLMGRFIKGTIHLTGLVLAVMVLLFVIVMVFLPVLLLSSVVSQTVASLVAVLGAVAALWLFIYLAFSVHDIYLNGSPFWLAMWNSGRLVQRFLLPTILLLAVIYGINSVFDLLWQLAENGTWLTLMSVIGHGFISTSLVAATFLYYQDRRRFLLNLIPGKSDGALPG
jgi:hypothetical protein